MTTMTRIWVRSVLEVGYVASVAILAIVATSDPNHMAYPAFDFSLALSMPSLLLLSPRSTPSSGTCGTSPARTTAGSPGR